MDDKRLVAAQKLLDTAQEFWEACNSEGQYGAVQWLEGTAGELIIYTRSEYRDTLMSNIYTMGSQKVHYFNGESMPLEEE